MTVYIEYVIIDNVVIDYMMLKATFSLTGKSFRKGRLFLCSIFGAFISLVYPLLNSIKPIMIIVKVLSGFLIMGLSNKYSSKRSYYINTLIFFTCTFLTGGVIMGIYSVFNLDYTKEYATFLMAVPVYFILLMVSRVIKFIYRRKDKINSVYNVEISLLGKTCTTKGFMDTGNGVYDCMGGVIFCGKTFFTRFIGDKIINVKYKKIEINTVSGKTENLCVKLDELRIYLRDKVNIFNNVTLCILKENTCEWDIILHPDLLEENNAEKFNEQIEKVS